MSNPRLLLVSGSPGAGASTIARAAERALRRQGRTVRLVTDDDASTHVQSALEPLLAVAGPLVGELMLTSSVIARADALLSVAHAMDEPDVEVVIWDAGPVGPLLEAFAAFDAVPVLLGQATSPIVSLLGSQLLEVRQVGAIRDLLDHVTSSMKILTAPTARNVFVDEPIEGLRARVDSARTRFALMSLTVDHVIVNRVPRGRDDWPRRWARERRQVARDYLAANPRAIRMRWLTSGNPVKQVAKRLPDLRTTRAVRIDVPSIQETETGYAFSIPLPGVDPNALRVGLWGDALVVELDGLRRLIALPSVLTRCAVDGAGLVRGDLVTRFTPDPDRWPVAS